MSFWCVVLVLASVPALAVAASATVPAKVQAQLLARILPYERGFQRHPPPRVKILVARRGDDDESAADAHHMRRALLDISKVAGRPIDIESTTFETAPALRAQANASGAAIVYISSGLGHDVPALARAFAGSGVLTMSADEGDVARGAVLGIALDNGKPRIGINLKQARAQNLDFPAALLKLARVY